MRFEPLPLAGAWRIAPEPVADARGWFARTYDRAAFAAHGIDLDPAVAATSFTEAAGTIRGLHFQAAPHGEAKLIRCAAGAAWDVLVDVRPGSPTFGAWVATELSAANGLAHFAPPGLAHGFQALSDGTEVAYLLAGAYAPSHARGYRHDDPAFAIPWPLPPTRLAARDRSWPAFPAAGYEEAAP